MCSTPQAGCVRNRPCRSEAVRGKDHLWGEVVFSVVWAGPSRLAAPLARPQRPQVGHKPEHPGLVLPIQAQFSENLHFLNRSAQGWRAVGRGMHRGRRRASVVPCQKFTRSPPLRSRISRASLGVATWVPRSSTMRRILATCWAFDSASTPRWINRLSPSPTRTLPPI